MTTATQTEFLRLYAEDPDFHREVDRLLADEVVELRAALAQIADTRRTDFATGFEYEMVVRKTAAGALRRLVTE